MAAQGTAFWRLAGLNFIQYQHIAAQTLRGALKESVKTNQVKAREVVHFRIRPWDKGTKGEATIVSNILSRVNKSASSA